MVVQEIAVNTDTLQSDINDMRRQLGLLQTKTTRISERVMALNSMWEGPAHEAFSREFQRDCTDMQELLKTVGDLIEHMQTADREYIACESAVRSTIGTIRV